jgi:hypothetical protein
MNDHLLHGNTRRTVLHAVCDLQQCRCDATEFYLNKRQPIIRLEGVVAEFELSGNASACFYLGKTRQLRCQVALQQAIFLCSRRPSSVEAIISVTGALRFHWVESALSFVIPKFLPILYVILTAVLTGSGCPTA